MSLPYEVKVDGKFKFIEEGQGEPLILLHGLFGAMSNFAGIINHFRHTHQVIVPLLPLFELDLLHTTVDFSLLAGIVVLATGGIILGNFLNNKMDGTKLKKGFGWFVLVMGIYIIIKELAFPGTSAH